MDQGTSTDLERLFAREPAAASWVSVDPAAVEAWLASQGEAVDDDRLFEVALVFGCVGGEATAVATFEALVLDRIPEIRGNQELRQDLRVHALLGESGAPGRLASFEASDGSPFARRRHALGAAEPHRHEPR